MKIRWFASQNATHFRVFANQFNNLAHSGANHLERGNVSVRFINIQPCQQSDCSCVCLARMWFQWQWDTEIAGVVRGQVFPGEMQATKQHWPYCLRTKLEEEATGDVSPQSAEPAANTAETRKWQWQWHAVTEYYAYNVILTLTLSRPYMFIHIHCVSKKTAQTLKRYSSKWYGSILIIFGRNIQKSLE